MKLFKFFLLTVLVAASAFGQNRLKDKAEVTSLLTDDYFFVDGATGGVRKWDTSGSMTKTPATITITEASPDTGAINIVRGYSQATIDEATTLTPSAAGASGQFLALDVINSGAAAYVITVDTATDFTLNAAASATTTVLLRSDGAGWLLVGGDPSVIGLTADTTPASALLVAVTDASTGTIYKSTIDQLGSADSTLITNAKIDTVAELRAITVGLGRAVTVSSWATPSTANPLTLTAADCNGAIVYYNVAGTINLPTGADGLNVVIVCNVTARVITINPGDNDYIVKAGVAGADGATITATCTAGQYVAMVCDADGNWTVIGYTATLS